MKTTACFCLSLLLLTGTTSVLRGETFRTDINPAQIYYQAFLLEPQLSKADNEYWVSNNWEPPLSPRLGAILTNYDMEMSYLHRAAVQTVPCDWGIDMSPGPLTLLPELVHCKRAAQAAGLHAVWELQNGDQAGAQNDLLGALALGRNSSRDSTLIGVLVQIAIENIVVSDVAKNFSHFAPQTLQALATGFNAPPTRGTVSAAMTAERFSGGSWLHKKIREAQAAHPGDETAAMAELQEAIQNIGYENETNYWTQLTNAAGGTVAGLLKMSQHAEGYVKQMTTLLTLPEREFEDQFQQFTQTVQHERNFLITEALDGWFNSRRKELTVQVELAMVQAAIQYKLNGEAGLKSVMDPCGSGPFTYERFIFQGEDRGFKLTSTYIPIARAQAGHAAEFGFQVNPAHMPVTVIFVEKDGPPFSVSGLHAGQAAKP